MPQDLGKGCPYSEGSLQAASEALAMLSPAHLCTLFPSLPLSLLHFRFAPGDATGPAVPLWPQPAWNWRGDAAPCHPEQQPSPSPC